MFDKLTLNYEWDGGDFSPSLGNLEVAWESRDSRTGEESTGGYIMGMRVSVWPERKRMRIEGSLAKFLFHENVTMLTRETTQEALENLGEALGIDIGKARVSTLEFGVNIVVQREPWQYMQRLGEMPRRERKAYSRDTLYYEHKGREQPDALKIYDKGREAKQKRNKGMQIPKEMRGKNILRIELSLNSRLRQQLGVHEVTASSLYSYEVFEKLKALLLEKYKSIQKLNMGEMKLKNKTEKGIIDGFFCFFAHKTGAEVSSIMEEYFAVVKAAQVLKNRSGYCKAKSALNRKLMSARFLEKDSLIAELDKAFSEQCEKQNSLN